MRNAGLEEAQSAIKISGRNISNLRYADDTTLMAESSIGQHSYICLLEVVLPCLFLWAIQSGVCYGTE